MAKYKLAAQVRDQKGKEAAKKLRNEDKIPAVFYGAKSDSIVLTVEKADLKNIMKTTASDNIIMDLQIESEKGSETKIVMLKELQTDPINDTYIHADFYEISMEKELTINIPIRLINTPVGVTNGGILQHVRREMTISCFPDKLIEYIDADVSGLDIGETLHISDISFPDGITSMLEDHLTIAVVNAPTVAAAEEELEEEEEEIEGEEKETDKETEDETESGSE
jgi:large subunit ribosomal protein L25